MMNSDMNQQNLYEHLSLEQRLKRENMQWSMRFLELEHQHNTVLKENESYRI